METGVLIEILAQKGIYYFSGVPDSLLSSLCNYLMETVGICPGKHIVSHNEGGCVALAAGHHLATGSVPCVYLQNSGIGNIINPVTSLTHPKVYGIPMLFIVGWRGEPGVKDEPQHIYQGEVTLAMLESVGISYFILEKDTTEEELVEVLSRFDIKFQQGASAALVVRKGALTGGGNPDYSNPFYLVREQVVEQIAQAAGTGVLVSTTGKISRELFESRERCGGGHSQDFLTVGSMGHSSMIALGISQAKPKLQVWCVDGDGAALMHSGALAIVGSQKPGNLVHIVLNNAAHESVGGVPTAASAVDLAAAAKAFGYRESYCVADNAALAPALLHCANSQGPMFLEVRVALSSRDDLGRPTSTPLENKVAFMSYLRRK